MVNDARPLRISYIFPQFPVATQTFAASDINELAANGHAVTVYCIKPLDKATVEALKSIPVSPSITVLRPSRKLPIRAVFQALYSIPAVVAVLCVIFRNFIHHPKLAIECLFCVPRVVEIATDIEDKKFDIVHSFWGRHPSLVLAYLRRLRGDRTYPVLSSFAGAYDLVADDFLVDLGLNTADVLFTHAETNKKFFYLKSKPEVHVVYRGIPLLLDQSVPPKRDPFTIITASALTEDKNVIGVIDSFARAHNVEPRLRLVVCGSGPDEPRLRAYVSSIGLEESICFTGYIPREILFSTMQASRAFLFLSFKKSERLPNVVKEAMLAGCFVISSRTEGIEELLYSEDVGRIVNYQDADGIHSAISFAIAESEEAAKRRREEARNYIIEKFSTAGTMASYVSTWRRALAKRGNPHAN
ncbi:glycosyltransferase family 4 protein [Pannonibacter carbonis]|uniref:glycosyltransferase family 4 protein n=1 Tax=Pannonibacter carbonis TaxID=2067569 RepID=UPI000D112CFB|nr:glycosyltransferase family 4 protein [Pannonibacter carbonis]